MAQAVMPGMVGQYSFRVFLIPVFRIGGFGMKVLVVGLTGLVGGIESYVLNLMSLIGKDERFDFDFLIKGFERALCEDELKSYLKPNSQFFYVKNYRQDVIGCTISLRQIYSRGYDVVYLNSSFSSDVLFVLPYIDRKKTKVMMHSHTSFAEERGWQSRLFSGIANRKVDCKLACSVKAGEWLYGKKNTDSIHIIRNGIDTDRFCFSKHKRAQVREYYGINEKTMLVGHIGRFSLPKNHFYILQIIRVCMVRGMNIKFMMLGSGESYGKVVNKAKKMGINDAIIFTGIQGDVEGYYSAFDAFILPSLYEGLPFVGVEAQANGLPCFFSDRVDHDSLITDRCIMLPIGDGDIDRWVDAIETVISDRENIMKDRNKYSTVVSEKGFDRKVMAKDVSKMLMNLASNKEFD